MSVAIIVQARMAATRLPGKVLMPLGSGTILEQLVLRMRRCRNASIIVATTTNPADDSIVVASEALGVRYLRGSEDDVLSRFVAALDAADADIGVRVTADSPLVDPRTIDALVELLATRPLDYVSTAIDGTLPLGLGAEAFRADALRRANRETRSAWDREHVTPYLKRTDKGFRIGGLPSPRGDFSHVRVTVDTPQDLVVVSRVFDAVSARNPLFGVDEILTLSREQPDLFVHKADAAGKIRVDVDAPLVLLFRADASAEIGYGHLERCLRLASDMRPANITFLMRCDGTAAARAEQAGFGVRALDFSSELTADGWLDSLPTGPTSMVLDISHSLDAARRGRIASLCDTLGKRGVRRAVIDGLGADMLVQSGDFPAELVVTPYPGAPDIPDRAFSHLRGTSHAILTPDLCRPVAAEPAHARRLLITFGGSDSNHLTELAVEACMRLDIPGLDVTVVIGPGVSEARAEEIRKAVLALPARAAVILAPPNLVRFMHDAHLAVASTGLTKYELACAGLPSLLIALNESQAAAHRPFEPLGTSEFVGVAGAVSPADLSLRIAKLIADQDRRTRMRANGSRAVDGRGATRVAKAIYAMAQSSKMLQ